MTRRRNHRAAVAALLSLAALVVFVPPQLGAQADFSRYVAMGDSLTAGFTSGGLVQDVQDNSYPALIHRQIRGTDQGFEQPLISRPGIPPLLELVSLVNLTIAPSSTSFGDPVNLLLPRPYDNLGVPGATVVDAVDTVTDNGGFHDIVLRGLGTQLQQAAALSPTFVTVWLGQNDVLGAAVSGIVIDGVTLTPVSIFEQKYRTVINTLRGVGAQVAVSTLGSVTSIPFVTTIPPVVVDPTTNEPVLVNGNPVFLIGPNGPLTAADHVLLSASSLLQQGIGIPVQLGGTGQPLPDEVVLDAAETAAIENRVQSLNQVIRTVANEAGAAVADAEAFLEEIATEGVDIGGIEFTEDFLTGGFFSYDGVHPTPFGYAFTANVFIRAINDRFGESIPLVNLRPFLFDPTVTATGGLTAAELAGVVYSDRAADRLRHDLGLPSIERLKEIKRNRQNAKPAPPKGDVGPTPGIPEASESTPEEKPAKPAERPF